MRKSIFRMCIFSMLMAGIVFSQSGFRTVKQPNGKTLQVKDAGYCCSVMWDETPEGYVLTSSPDGYYCYTTMDEKGNLMPAVERAGLDSPTGQAVKATDSHFTSSIQKKVDDFNAAALENRKKVCLALMGKQTNGLSKAGSVAKIETVVNLDIGLLLVEFTDISHYTG